MKAIFLIAIILVSPYADARKENPTRYDPPAEEAEHLTPQEERFYALDDELAEAIFRNDKAAVVSLAEEYLQLAELECNRWNYGNAIHDAYTALGTIALREGDIKSAEGYLLKAGDTPGSPQLDTFGPNLELANSLLKVGSKDAVIQYLKKVSKFWEAGAEALPSLIERINSGQQHRLNQYEICCPRG